MPIEDDQLTEMELHRSFYCELNHKNTGSYYTKLAKCGSCKWFPCKLISRQSVNKLFDSSLMEIGGGYFIPRRKRMYLFIDQDGTIAEAYKGFDPKNPDWDKLRTVKEVLVVTKSLVPQLKLVPKPSGAPAAAPKEPVKRAKRSPKKAKEE